MPLYIKDDATADLVAQLARKRGVSKQDAVRLAVQAELRRITRGHPAPRAHRGMAEGAPDAASDRAGSRQSVLR